MPDSRAAHRYALAIIGLAEELKQFDRVSEDFAYLSKLLQQSRELLIFLKSPVINKEKKNVVLSQILKGKVSGLTFNFLKLLTAKGRETILPEIVRQFSIIHDERLNLLTATVRSAVPFTDEQRRELVNHLKRITKKDVRLQHVEDKDVIGGLMVQYEGTVWDGSIRRQLALLRKRFIESTK